MDLAVLGWDNDDDDEEESEMDRIAYDKMEADFLAKMKAERALAAVPQHVPAASDEVALSKASQFLEACFETLAYGDVPDESTLEHMRQTSGLSVATIIDVSPPPSPLHHSSHLRAFSQQGAIVVAGNSDVPILAQGESYCADSGWAGRSQLLEEHYLARDADEMLAAAEADDDDESGDDDESVAGESDASDGGGDDASSGSDAAPMQRAATQRAAVPRSAPAPRSASRALTDAAKARIKAIPTVCGPH